MSVKYICFYLPQFHEIDENNKWWGKGFTEWVHVKSAKSFFNGHYQPRIPLDYNYYNLLEVNTIQKQFELANSHGIYGFCFYHYWFNGKLLLERPAELLLATPQIEGKYCFSWANESWARTWNGQNKDVLIEQTYGEEEDWIKHIQYLMNFFRDERYIRINGSPVLLIYNSSKIDCLNKMVQVWNEELIKNSFPTLCIIDTLNSYNHTKHNVATFSTQFEPWFTITTDYKLRIYLKAKQILRKLLIRFISYDKIPQSLLATISFDYLYKQILKRKKNDNSFYGLFPDWDNSPRKAKTGHSTIVTGSTPEKFQMYRNIIEEKVKSSNENQFIFVNAWNEWGETACLEPDEKYKDAYLKAMSGKVQEDHSFDV